jgi:hypothetical protein
MFPYWILFSVFAAGTLQYGRKSTMSGRAVPFLAVGGILIALMIGFRFNVGGDWETYLQMFDEFRVLDLGQIAALGDPGYGFLNWLSQKLGFEIWFVNLICASIFAFGLVKFVKVQPNPWLAICVGVPYLIIVVAMGYTRQGVAIGLIMAGLAEFERQSLIRFAIYILLAASFHKTAVIVLPLVALTFERHRFAIGALLAVMGFFLYSWFLEASLDRLVTNYIDAEYQSQGAAIRVGMNLVPATLFLLFHKRMNLTESQYRLWRNFSYAAFVMLILLFAVASSTVVDRLALYIIPLQLFTLCRIPDAFPNRDGTRNGQLVLLVILYSALVQFVWMNYANHAKYWLPYRVYNFTEEQANEPRTPLEAE